jgi:hypothetical protein
VSKEWVAGVRGDVLAADQREWSVEQAGVEIVHCMGDGVAEPREVVSAHRVPVSGGVEPVSAVERGEVGRRADRLVSVKNQDMTKRLLNFCVGR